MPVERCQGERLKLVAVATPSDIRSQNSSYCSPPFPPLDTIHHNPYAIQKSAHNRRTVGPEIIEQDNRRLEVAPWPNCSPIAWGSQNTPQSNHIDCLSTDSVAILPIITQCRELHCDQFDSTRIMLWSQSGANRLGQAHKQIPYDRVKTRWIGIVSWSQIRTDREHHVLLPAIQRTVSQPQQFEANSPN